jgi:glycosyltransferase involved in cell wall biosynthesis
MAVPSIGGAELHLLRLLDGLAPRGWAITVTAPGDGPVRRRVLERGWSFRQLELGGLGHGQGLRAIRGWPRVRSLAGHADIVYLNGGVCGRLLPALSGRRGRRVLHVHDMVTRVPWSWRRADVVLADSAAVAARLTGLRPEVVYGPADPDPPERSSPWPEQPRPVIGFVGRVEPRKAPADLVAAMPLVRRSLPDARCVIVGDDPLGTDLAYTRAVLSSPEVEAYPWQEDAASLMRHLDVLVLPSRREPFGTVAAEALMAGTPVVATRVDGLREVVTDGVDGRLVAPGDPAALASAILDVLSRRPAMSSAARHGARRFATPEYVDRVERLLTR